MNVLNECHACFLKAFGFDAPFAANKKINYLVSITCSLNSGDYSHGLFELSPYTFSYSFLVLMSFRRKKKRGAMNCIQTCI